jgi:dynein-related subfamily AAA family protein
MSGETGTGRRLNLPNAVVQDCATAGALSDLLDATVRVQLPLLLWGPPGVGKSASVRRWAERRGLACWTVLASLREPSDFAGLPIVERPEPDANGARSAASVSFAPPRFAREAAERGGVIFLDELTTAPPAVQAALLRAVVDRAFGDLELDPARVALVAAANPPDEAAGGWELAAPLANRFVHLSFPLQPGEWVASFPDYWGTPPRLGYQEGKLAADRWAEARRLVACFIRARPSLLLQLPAEVSQRGGAWPSPRTWDYASRLLASLEQTGAEPAEVLPLLAGCVGEGAALEFVSWRQALDLPDPEALLARPNSYRHPPRTDQAYATLDAVCQAALDHLTVPRWQAAWRVLAEAAAQGGADVAAAAARRLAAARRSDLPLPAREVGSFFPLLRTATLVSATDRPAAG